MTHRDATFTEDCRAYWGGHACQRHRGHKGSHVCHCGDRPPSDATFYGEDSPLKFRVKSVVRNFRVWGPRLSWGVLRRKA